MDDIYKNIEEYNPNKRHKILIVFDDMIVGNLNPIVQKTKYFSCIYYTTLFCCTKQY